MTTIKLATNDQHLMLLEQVVVASGDKNTVQVYVKLDHHWDGYAISVAFYRNNDRDLVLDVPLTGGTCMVPAKMLETPCLLNIGIWGKDTAGRYKTSTLVKYRVLEGTPIEGGVVLTDVSDGTADEDQVLAGATFYAGDTAKKTGNIATFEDGDLVYVGLGESEVDPTVPDWAKQPTKPTYTADEVGALPADKLPEAISAALAQAKESGEFDGEDGVDGKDGYTPIKDVDYFDGVDGKDGAPGSTPFIGTNGNWWIGEVDTGVAAGGSKGLPEVSEEDNGKTLAVVDGAWAKITPAAATIPDIPFYDLAALGLPTVKTDDTISELAIDTTAIRAALDKGAVKFALNVDGSGLVEVVMNKYEVNGLYICTYTAFNLTLTLMIASNGLQASAAEAASASIETYNGAVEVRGY